MLKDLKELPKISDSVSFLYIEYAKIEQDNFSIKIVQGDSEIPVPVTQFCTLFLGPGISITHQAVKICADMGVLLIWYGENLSFYYAHGLGETKSSSNLLKQIEYFSDDEKHLEIVRKMYKLRFSDLDMSTLSLKQMQSMEGVRVRSLYNQFAKLYGVQWNGRTYKKDRYENSDSINKAITYGCSLLYGICHSVILSMGYSPAIGFIHIRNQRSFVFDIADLYKGEFIIPLAFQIVKEDSNNIEKRLRKECHKIFGQKKLLQRIAKDLQYLFGSVDADNEKEEGRLWGITSELEYGRNYGELDK